MAPDLGVRPDGALILAAPGNAGTSHDGRSGSAAGRLLPVWVTLKHGGAGKGWVP